jgi:hypothetical protein
MLCALLNDIATRLPDTLARGVRGVCGVYGVRGVRGDDPGCSSSAAVASAASRASTIHGGSVRVAHAQALRPRLATVSVNAAPTERQYQRTKRRGC